MIGAAHLPFLSIFEGQRVNPLRDRHDQKKRRRPHNEINSNSAHRSNRNREVISLSRLGKNRAKKKLKNKGSTGVCSLCLASFAKKAAKFPRQERISFWRPNPWSAARIYVPRDMKRLPTLVTTISAMV
jgi:hypothetical protein